MGDKRTDPGHYYPGGKVRAKSGTAPQGLTVQWNDIQGKPDFSDIADLTTHDGQGRVKEVVNTIKERMKG